MLANYVKDLFLVSSIPASGVAVSSSEAKKRALVSARENAFFIVLKRIMDSENIKTVIVPDAYNMEKFIQTIRINDEKISPTSYNAVVDIQINKSLMSEYLKNQGYKIALEVPPSTLIIPVANSEIDNIFNSSWFKAFQDGLTMRDYDNLNIVPLVLPSSDYVNDFTSYGINRIRVENISDLQNVLSNSAVSNILLIDLENLGNDNYSVTLTDKKSESVSSFEINDSDINEVAEQVILNINDKYKNYDNSGTFSKSIPIIIPIRGIADWINTEKILSKISDIRVIEVRALKYNKAQLKLVYNYDLNSVINSLRAAGFNIENKNDYLIVKK